MRHRAEHRFGLVLLAVLAGCGDPSSPDADGAATAVAPPPMRSAAADGTRTMVARLEQAAMSAGERGDLYANQRRAETLRTELASAVKPRRRMQLGYELAWELLRAGQSEEALAIAEALRATPGLAARAPAVIADLNVLVAISYLRLGEQENCIAHHGIDSCLMPIRGGGVHTETRGARGAIREYSAILAADPGALAAQWLLNIAYMAVGEYPGGVPERWRIPPDVFASDAEMPRFFDVAPKLGLALDGLSGGSVLDDFDGDGHLDVMASSWSLDDQLKLFLSNGDGTYRDHTAAAGLSGITGGLNLMSADVDNDGAVDVLVLRGAWRKTAGHVPNSLLRNHGDGRFADVTAAAGLLTARPTQVAAWGDFDNDGLVDLFVGNESLPGDRNPSELYRNLGGARFEDRTAWLGEPDMGYVKGAAWGDVDNDDDLDLFVSNYDGRNRLLRNDGAAANGAVVFTDVTEAVGVAGPARSFATWFWDYDNDGWLDLFVGACHNRRIVGDVAALYLGREHGAELPRLYKNRGDGRFADVTAAARLDRVSMMMAVNYGDLDNDGWLDMYLGTGYPQLTALMPNRMFKNAGGERFDDVTTAGGFGHLQKGHGISFADLDNDGDQDIYAVMGGAYRGDGFPNALFENPGHESNRWLTLRLVGTRSNRAGIGARIRVRVERTDGRERSIHLLAGTGGSFGASSLQQEIGLGDSRRVIELVVRWPASGLEQRFTDVAMDRFYRLVEGSDSLVRVAVERVRLGGSEPGS